MECPNPACPTRTAGDPNFGQQIGDNARYCLYCSHEIIIAPSDPQQIQLGPIIPIAPGIPPTSAVPLPRAPVTPANRVTRDAPLIEQFWAWLDRRLRDVDTLASRVVWAQLGAVSILSYLLLWLIYSTAGADLGQDPILWSVYGWLAAVPILSFILRHRAGRVTWIQRAMTIYILVLTIVVCVWLFVMIDHSMAVTHSTLPDPCQDNWGNCG